MASPSQDRQASAEIEITPEMVEVGMKVYRDRLPEDASLSHDDGETVALIFRAMEVVGRKSARSS